MPHVRGCQLIVVGAWAALGLAAGAVWAEGGDSPEVLTAEPIRTDVVAAGPVRSDAGFSAYALSTVFQILFPTVGGVLFAACYDESRASWRRLRQGPSRSRRRLMRFVVRVVTCCSRWWLHRPARQWLVRVLLCRAFRPPGPPPYADWEVRLAQAVLRGCKTVFHNAKLLATIALWKLGCDLGFFWAFGTPERAFNGWGLTAYTLIQFLACHVLGEQLIRDGVLWFLGREADRPVAPRRRAFWAFVSKWFYESDDGISPSAPPVYVLTKPFIVLFASLLSWPAYDVGAYWGQERGSSLVAVYWNYQFALLSLFTLGGYFGRIWSYNLGEFSYVLLLERRIMPQFRRIAARLSFLVNWLFVWRIFYRRMKKYRIDTRFFVQRAFGVVGVALWLPALAYCLAAVKNGAAPENLAAPARRVYEPTPLEHEPTIVLPSTPAPAAPATPASVATIVPLRLRLERVTREPLDPLDGSILVQAEGEGAIYLTRDGTLPDPDNTDGAGRTERYKAPFFIGESTIIRARAYKAGNASAVRSAVVTPNRWTVELTDLPGRGLAVRDVFVTGEFRKWNTEGVGRFRLDRRPDGGFEGTVIIDGTIPVQYKYLVRYQDGSASWYTDPAASTVTSLEGHYNNVVYPAVRVRDKLLARHDGVLEESFIEPGRFELDSRHIRLWVTTLEGDIESAAVKWPHTAPRPLFKTSYARHGIEYADYSAIVELPDDGADTTYTFLLTDKDQHWSLGPDGLKPQVPAEADQIEARLTPEDRFTFRYPATRELASDFRSRTVYFALVDRFVDGNPDNNAGNNADLFDPAHRDLLKYYGGDLRGLAAAKSLQYLEQLGIGGVWVTPLVKNVEYRDPAHPYAAYHGYWGLDFYEIDEHFGTWEDLDRFVTELHRRGMKLVLDFVPNHASPTVWYWPGRLEQCGRVLVETYQQDGERPEGEQWFHHVGGMYVEQYDRFPDRVVRDSAGNADFRCEAPHVARYLLGAAQLWLDRGADAFRIDSLKHIDPGFARRFAHELREYARQKGRSELYVCGEWMGGGPLNAASMAFYHSAEDFDLLDFSLAYSLRGLLANHESMRSLSSLLRHRRMAFRGRETWQATFLDNHDTERIGTFLVRPRGEKDGGGGLSPEVAARRIDLGLVLVMTLPGIPVVYYGTEQYVGIEGVDPEKVRRFGTDTCGRVMMPDFKTTQPAVEIVSRLAALRRVSPAVQRGPYEEKHVADDVLVYQRREGSDVVVVAVNRGPKQRVLVNNLALADGRWERVLMAPGAEVAVRGGTAELTLPENGAIVLRSQP